MTFGWGASRGVLRSESAQQSLERLRTNSGAEWIALSFWTWQDHIYATEIPFDYGYTVTDLDITDTIARAHDLGLKVCLKPVVNSRDGIWRAHIGFPDEAGAEPYWRRWFDSYRNFLRHYAEIAEAAGCELFSVGCEMIKTESQEALWRGVIDAVRQAYGGPLVYNANHGGEERVPFWDALDLIGTSAYYPVGPRPGASWEEMAAHWDPVRSRLRALAERTAKPIAFLEIGCRSALGCAAMPWDFTHRDLPPSEAEQAAFYQAALASFWEEPWFRGFFWWDWSPTLYPRENAATDTGFDIYGKAAEAILRDWYNRPRP